MPKLTDRWFTLLTSVVLIGAAAVAFAFGKNTEGALLLVSVATAVGVRSMRGEK